MPDEGIHLRRRGKMNTRRSILSTVLLISVLLAGCGPSRAEPDGRSGQVVARTIATQKPAVPTPTPTFTASPVPTATPTSTATATVMPTDTPTITPTPEPDLSDVIITVSDLPDGFMPLSSRELDVYESGYGEGARAFSFTLDAAQFETITGVAMPIDLRSNQEFFDQNLPNFVDFTVKGLEFNGTALQDPEELTGLEEIGETRYGMTTVIDYGGVSYRWDVVAFRRGSVGMLVLIAYLDGDEPVMPVADLAILLDERAGNFVAANP
jgi:hypothetical protein